MKPCSFPNCPNPRLAKGLCSNHYQRVRARTDPSFQEGINAYARQWRQTPQAQNVDRLRRLTPKRRLTSYQAHAKKKGYVSELTLEFFTELTSKPCTYCGGFSRDHSWVGLDRIDSDIGYLKSNVVPCCEACNKAKSDRSVDDFLAHCRKVILHLGRMRGA